MLPGALHIGKCIYCGSLERLSDEHILPEGLGGRDILREASCEPCCVETCRLEGHVQQKMIHAMRIRMGFHGKRKHPDTLPILVHKASGETVIEQIDPRNVVMAAMLPRLSPPGILTGAPRHELRDGQLDIYGKPESISRLSAQGIFGETSHQIRIHWFARAIAKIAHAGAIQRLGLDGFEPFLRDVIRGKADEVYYYVGCKSMERPPAEHDFGSWLSGEVIDHGGDLLVVMYVRLLAQIGTPIYQVVTGRIVRKKWVEVEIPCTSRMMGQPVHSGASFAPT